MRKVIVLGLCILSLLGAREVLATGIGPYFEYGYGAFSPKVDDLLGISIPETEINFKANHITFGFLLDTCTSQDKLFNYRLTVGLDIVPLKLDSFESLGVKWDPNDLGVDLDQTGWGFNMKHTFGFGILRTSAVRVWAGPALRLYCDFFGEAANPYNVDPYSSGDSSILLGGGAGPEVGVNIHLGGTFSIGVSGGYNFNYAAYILGDDTLSGAEHMFYVQVAPIFNVGADRNVWQ